MQRYFGDIINDKIILNDDDVFHITHVMRAKPADKFEVVANEKVYLCQVNRFSPFEIDIVNEIVQNNELSNNVILIAALIKGERMDFLLQKATELGANEIVLLETERTVIKIDERDKEKKFIRFRKILKEAAEQSKRLRIPKLDKLISIKDLKNIDAEIKMIAYEAESGTTESLNGNLSKIKNDERIAIVIGPEGGFSENEVGIAESFGYKRVSLGKRILRAETASFYALSVIGNYLERN